MNKGLLTLLLLFVANTFMTIAWYGHLKFTNAENGRTFPLIVFILISWGIAFIEYCFQIPANRIGFDGNGGPFSLLQLKVIQEVISLCVFVGFSLIVFRNEQIRWNHLAAFICIILAVYFVFRK